MRIFCLVLGLSLAISASHARLTPQTVPSAALPATGDLKNVVAEESNRMEKSLKKRMANPYEDDEFEETAHGLMSDSGSSVKSYVVQRPEGEEEEEHEVKRVKKSKRKHHEDSDEVEEEETEDELERKDTKAADDMKYTYDPEYLEQGYLLPVAVKKGKKDRKDVKKNKKKKYEEDSEEEVHDDKKKNKEEESEEEADEEAEDEEEDDEPQAPGQGPPGGTLGNKKQGPPPKELLQTLMNTYGFIPEQLQQAGQQGGQGGPGGPGGRPPHGGGYGGGGPGGPPGGYGGGPHGGPDGPHYDFPPRTPGAKYDYGTPPPDTGNYPHPPQNFGPSSQEQQPSLIGSMLSRLNPFKRNDQPEYPGGPNGQYGGGQYGGPPNNNQYGPPNGQFNGPPPPNGQYNGPPSGHHGHGQEQSGPPPPRGPPKRKHKYRASEHQEEDYNGPSDMFQNDQGPHPYGYEPEPSASEIRVKPLMSRLSSLLPFGTAPKTSENDPFISVRY